MPEAMELAGAELVQVFVGKTLPLAKMLLGKIIDRSCFRAWDPFGSGQTGTNDRSCGLVGAAQVARHPNRASRKLPGKSFENGGFEQSHERSN
jgi:hypothetical protein